MDPIVLATILGALLVMGLGGGAALMLGGPSGNSTKIRRMAKFVNVYAGALPSEARTTEVRKRQISKKVKSLTDAQRDGAATRVTVRSLIAQSGLDLTVQQFWIIRAVSGTIVTAIGYFAGAPLYGMPFVVFVGVMYLPLAWLRGTIKSRQKKFNEHFADAIDIITRGLKSGLPVGECFNVIARESPEPVSTEFRIIVEQVKIGLPLEQAVMRSLERMPTAEMKFFSVVLAIQQQTGGNLAAVLSNISGVLRGRAQLRGKVQALSSEAKASAMIIGALPPLVACLLFLVNPNYAEILFFTETGQNMMLGGLGWMGIGILIMRSMINMET